MNTSVSLAQRTMDQLSDRDFQLMKTVARLPPMDLPKLSSCAELLQMTFPDPVWIVPSIIPEGLSLLAGPPKVGKSWFCLQLGSGVSSGSEVFGQSVVAPQQVVYLALEDTQRRIQNRLRLMTAAPCEYFKIAVRWERGQDAINALKRLIHDLPEIRLIVIDTLARVLPSGIDTNDYHSTGSFMSELKAVADDYGVSIVICHHLRKAPADDFVNSVGGSTAIAATADTVLVLRRGRSSHDAILDVTGRDVEEKSIAMRFNGDLYRWEALGDSARVQKTDERQAIFEVLEEADEPLGPKEIAERVNGSSPQSVRHLVLRMEQDGAILKLSRGQYGLAPQRSQRSQVHSDSGRQCEQVNDVNNSTVYGEGES